MLNKNKRTEDKELLETVRSINCIGCLKDPPNEAHHVTSRGAGGDDSWDNVMPLCQACHYRWHLRGPGYMIENHPAIKTWLEMAGRQDVFDRIKKSTRSI